jgi:hypothetical protein
VVDENRPPAPCERNSTEPAGQLLALLVLVLAAATAATFEAVRDAHAPRFELAELGRP